MMPHRRLYQFICILFLFFAGGRIPLCAQQITQTLSWEEDPSILEYEVCIERLQSDGTYGEILRQKTEHSPLSVSLEPGIYRYVVFAFDLLGRIIPEAVWHKFEISSPSAEILSTAAVPVVYKGGDKNAMVFKTEVQNLAWNEDSSVLEYEITIEQELESGEYTQIQKTRTERTHIQTAFSAGNYRYRITVYDLLGRGHVSDWISFSVLPQEQVIPAQPEVPSSVPLQPDSPLQMPEPVLITGFDVQSVQLWEQEELQTVLSVSGVQQESQAVLRDSRGVSYPVKICAADEVSVTICAADTEIPNGTYTVVITNPETEPAEAALLTVIRYFYPQILSVSSYRNMINPARDFAFEIQTRNVPPDSTAALHPDSGGDSVPVLLEQQDDDLYRIIIEENCLRQEDLYTIQILTADGQSCQWSSIDIAFLPPPNVTELTAAQGLFFKDDTITLSASGSGFTDNTVFYLLTEQESKRKQVRHKKAIFPLSVTADDNSAELIFRAGDIPNTRVVLYADREGQLSQPSPAVEIFSRTRFELSLGGGIQPSFMCADGGLGKFPPGYYYSGLENSSAGLFTLIGPFAVLDILPYKARWGYVGIEFSASYAPWLCRTPDMAVWTHLLITSANLMYQYAFFDDLLRLGVYAGGGAGLLWRFGNPETPSGESYQRELFPAVSAGMELRINPNRHFYASLRLEYTALLRNRSADGFIRPCFAAGIYF